MGYEDFKDLARRTEFNIANNLKYDEYQRGLALMVYKFFDKKTSGVVLKMRIFQTKN